MRRKLNNVLRREILERDNDSCVCCGYPASEVHHIEAYSDLIGLGKKLEEIDTKENLVSMCAICHEHVPFPQTKENFEEYKKLGGAATWHILGRIFMAWKTGIWPNDCSKTKSADKFTPEQLVGAMSAYITMRDFFIEQAKLSDED